MAALVAVHTLLFEPGALVLLLSPSLRQSQELFRKLLAFYAALDRPVPSEAESALRLELGNGSRVVSLPGKESTVRGYSNVTLMVVDEAARVEDSLFHATRPMLAVSHGRLVCMSTPWGRRGFFYEAWHSPASWERYRVTASQCPRISPEFLAEEKASMGAYWYRQEYETEFLEAETAVFTADQIDASLDPGLQPFGFLGPEWI